MKEGPDIAAVAALIGDPARANILTALMMGKALTASELAAEAGVTLQTTSSHLSKLLHGQMITVRKQGRHKYFSLASDAVAEVVETLMGFAAGTGGLRTRTGPRDPALRHARVCYNHLAGARGVQMFDAMVTRGFLSEDGALTAAGAGFVTEFGVDLVGLRAARAPVCRLCLDWSARRSHLAGSLGRAMFSVICARGWAVREDGSRVVRFTSKGAAAFDAAFGRDPSVQ